MMRNHSHAAKIFRTNFLILQEAAKLTAQSMTQKGSAFSIQKLVYHFLCKKNFKNPTNWE
jgi:hypothetical protein